MHFGLMLALTNGLLCGDMVEIGSRQFMIHESALVENVGDTLQHSFGVLTDSHGDIANVKYFADEFVERKVDGIIITGDIADMLSWYITKDGENVLRILAETELPVYVLPGNHDMRQYYEETIKNLGKEHANIIDLLKYRRIDACGVNFVSNPYGDGKHYVHTGYLADESRFNELEHLLCSFSDNDPVILITHQPPKCNGVYGVDYTLGKKNDGSIKLDEIMCRQKVKFSLSGHIHSATNGCTEESKPVLQKTFSTSLRLNPGAVLRHKTTTGYSSNAAIITVNGKELMYEILQK